MSMLIAILMAQAIFPTPYMNPPGKYNVSWVGNTFGGDKGGNGRGRWVQNAADEVEVTPDGTVIAVTGWDEAGRCLGLYKDGQPNIELLKLPDQFADESWGWGTGSSAVACEGNEIAIINGAGRLCTFTWTPGDLESPKFDRQTIVGGASSLTATKTDFVAADDKSIRWYRRSDLTLRKSLSAQGIKDVAAAPDGSIWAIQGQSVRRVDPGGNVSLSLRDHEIPVALNFGPDGTLYVCDGGLQQQVLVFRAGPDPVRVSTFGQSGGLRTGSPGAWDAMKFFSLRGASRDQQGRWHVAMGYSGEPSGGLTIRSFDRSRKFLRELHSGAFVDPFGFDPGHDGAIVYSRYARYDLNLTKTVTGSKWKLTAFTADPLVPDGRQNYPQSAVLRRPQGKLAMYTIGMYSGGYTIYTPPSNSQLWVRRTSVGQQDRWAWYVDSQGDIWQGDADNRTILRWKFKGWVGEEPQYDWSEFESLPWPEGWNTINRLIYDTENDRMYIFGYPTNKWPESWGLVGSTGVRYDNWSTSRRRVAWTIPNLPRDGNGGQEGPLTPKCVDLAGDYLFFGMSRPVNGLQYIHIYSISNGRWVGTFRHTGQSGIPMDGLGTECGWLDLPVAINALKRKNGEYLLLMEEGFRGKNLLFRWTP